MVSPVVLPLREVPERLVGPPVDAGNISDPAPGSIRSAFRLRSELNSQQLVSRQSPVASRLCVRPSDLRGWFLLRRLFFVRQRPGDITGALPRR